MHLCGIITVAKHTLLISFSGTKTADALTGTSVGGRVRAPLSVYRTCSEASRHNGGVPAALIHTRTPRLTFMLGTSVAHKATGLTY